MTTNVGDTDRMVRFVIGFILILAPLANMVGLTLSPVLISISVIIGIVLLATAFFRFCPLYRALGRTTIKH